MQILNLINKEKGDINYSLSKFPDGEVQITLGEFSHKDTIDVKCRIASAEDLFILMQVCDIIKRHGVPFIVSIYYLMGMRMDRVMDFNRPFTLSVVCNALDNLKANLIKIFSPHSYQSIRLIKKTKAVRLLDDPFNDILELKKPNGCKVVYPDEGAKTRYFFYSYSDGAILCEKNRDLATGKITSIKIVNPEDIKNTPLIVRDDLCDGGGTFVGISQAIREVKPDAIIDIYVDHMVNPKGIENLSKNFNHVWFTNSYKTWENLPDNVTQIEIV